LSDLCRPGGSNTVVEVTKHGWLPRHPSLYYMDMEYCLETLESRIHGAGQKSEIASTLDSEIHEGEVDSLSTGSLAAASSKIASSNDPNESPPEFDWQSVVNIIEDINRGLIYLHQNKTVHRDLKPKNVLFSERGGHWKLADFGTASKATSKHLHTTRYARGTNCYRAPEILKENAKVNNKVDMFALGCILYEATTGQKLFPDDWKIREYSLRGDPIFPTLWPSCDPGSRLYSLGELAQSLLQVDPFNRPSALQTKTALELIRHDKVPQLGMVESSHHNCVKRSRQPSPPRTVNVAQVQYRRSLPSFLEMDELPRRTLNVPPFPQPLTPTQYVDLTQGPTQYIQQPTDQYNPPNQGQGQYLYPNQMAPQQPVAQFLQVVEGNPFGIVLPRDFPPLHSLPPSFWEPVVQQPQPDPTPPMRTPLAPSLESLASRYDGKGKNFSDDSLKAIIIKAQPHHSSQSLSHLRREQLVKHVDDLVIWWKQANPEKPTRAQYANPNEDRQADR
jgi:serine/threonine protein kinase